MDPETENEAFLREQDEQFWEEKRRADSTTRRPGARKDAQWTGSSSAPLQGLETRIAPEPVHDESLSARSPAASPLPKPKKAGKPVLTSALVLLLLLGAAAAFKLWSSDGLPFTKKKSESSTALAGVTSEPSGISPNGAAPALPPTEPLPAPALPATGASPSSKAAPVDSKLQEQIDRLEKRLDQLVAGFKAQGYIKDTAGQEGADLVAADILPHPSTLPPPAPARVAVAARPATRKPVLRPAPAPSTPKPTHQVLSVDMWDGRPSVVVGVVGAPAGQVRVLAPGDSYAGVTLTAVDVAAQRATFSDGNRSVSIAVERQP